MSGGGAALRVLFLDDEPADAERVRSALAQTPTRRFSVTHLERLEELARLPDVERFDVVLVDLASPAAGGVHAIRLLERAAPRTPVLALSGDGRPDTRLTAIRAGAEDLLVERPTLWPTLGVELCAALARARRAARGRDAPVEGCLIVDAAGTVRFANRAAGELLGANARAGAALPARLRDHLELLAGSRRGDAPRELEIVAPSGVRVVELREVASRWGDAPARLVTLLDVTERRQRRALENQLAHAERLAAIGRLAAGVAHEINNPATFIAANARLFVERLDALRDAPPPEVASSLPAQLEELRELALESLEGLERVTSIVRDLGAFARVDRPQVERADLRELIEAAARMVRNELRHRARFELWLEELPPLVVDRGRLTQVFLNLLVNASQALGDDPQRNRVSVRAFADGEAVTVTVEDTGCGIAPEHLGALFEPFFTTKPSGQGTGLGLALSRETVRRHGGDIAVDSTPGRGTVFTVRLPRETGLRAAEAPRPPARPLVAAPARRVLLVDDDPRVRRAIARLLRGRHEVVEANGGPDALRRLERDAAFDAVLCDLMMPEIDGLAVLEHLRRHRPALARRLVFISGGVFSERARRALESGPAPVVEKPARREELLEALERVARRSSAPPGAVHRTSAQG